MTQAEAGHPDADQAEAGPDADQPKQGHPTRTSRSGQGVSSP